MTKEKISEVFCNDDVEHEEGYSYQIKTSCAPKNFYQFESDKANDSFIMRRHIEHIVSDTEEDGWEVLLMKAFLKDEDVYVNLLIRKKGEL